MPTNAEIKQAQRAGWDSVADGWSKWHDFLDEASAHINEWIAQGANLDMGMRALDLASGSGQPAITVADQVRPGGKVIASDIAPSMVAALKQRLARSGPSNVEVVEMDMEALDFPDAGFDAVTSRFGFMFCPDLPKAFSEARRVLKPGGRLSFAVWDTPAQNRWFTLVLDTLDAVSPAPPADPKAPGPFRLCDQAELVQLLKAAGFSRWQIESRAFPHEFNTATDYWDYVTDIAAPLRHRLLQLSPADQDKVRSVVIAEAQKIDIGNRIVYNGVTLCVWAE